MSKTPQNSWGHRDLPDQPSVALKRIADQIDFFDKRSKQNQTRYKRLKTATIMFAAAITVSAAFSLPRWLVPTLGALIVVLEGIVHLNSMLHNWLAYRNTCEALKHEKYLHLSRAGPYAGIDDPEKLLAERTEDILNRDRSSWISVQKDYQTKQRDGKAIQA